MAIKNNKLKIDNSLRPRGGTSSELKSINPFITRREIVIETDTGRIKVGDGVNSWNDLPYMGTAASNEIEKVSLSILGIENEPVLIPAAGDQYIVGDEPTGEFEGTTSGSIARYKETEEGGTWEFLTPVRDIKVINIRNGYILKYNGSEWQHIATISLQNNAKLLNSIVVTDAEQDITLSSTDTWNFSAVTATAQYSYGFGNAIDPSLSQDVTSLCQFSVQEGTQVSGDGECSVTIKYIEGGRTASGDFSRNIVGDNVFLPYFNYTVTDTDITISNFNFPYCKNNPISDIIVYSKVLDNGVIKNVLLSPFNNISAGIPRFITGNFLFPSKNYTSTSTSFYFGRLHSLNFNTNVQLPNGITSFCETFSGCGNLNSSVIIPNSAVNCRNMFRSCTNFNQPVNIPDNVTDCIDMFNGCRSLNQPIHIGNNVNDCFGMFYTCQAFNQPLNIPDSVDRVTNMLYDCTKFNSLLSIGGNVSSGLASNDFFVSQRSFFNAPVKFNYGLSKTSNLFYNCTAFNQPITLPGSITNCYNMFDGAKAFNSPVTIENGVTSTKGLFYNATGFHQSVYIPDSVTDCSHMFHECTSFNEPVRLPNSVGVNTAYMFYNCKAFNQPLNLPITTAVNACGSTFHECIGFNSAVTFPGSGHWSTAANIKSLLSGRYLDVSTANTYNYIYYYNFNAPVTFSHGITSLNNAFSMLKDFNQPVNIPDSVTDCSSIFHNCTNFNYPITVPNAVTDCHEMFRNCVNFNQPVNIPDSVTNCVSMFWGCTNFNSSITFGNNVNTIAAILQGCSNFNSAITIGAKMTGMDIYNSVFISVRGTFNAPVTFTTGMTNLSQTFQGLTKFNQPVNIPDTVTQCAFMFSGCSDFNAPIKFGNAVKNCTNMFNGATKLSQNIVFPSTATLLQFACAYCPNISHIYIQATSPNINRLVLGHQSAIQNVTIHCANMKKINIATVASVVGANITWDANNYNAYYKVQLTTDMTMV